MDVRLSYQFKKHTFKKAKSLRYTHERMIIEGKNGEQFGYYTRLVDWVKVIK